jgi:hypothetical protein
MPEAEQFGNCFDESVYGSEGELRRRTTSTHWYEEG